MSTEEADQLRGHDWYPRRDVMGRIPDLYATENTPIADKVVYLHYFTGAFNWWIVELSKDRSQLAFGYANLGDDQMAEWGYVDLGELRGLLVKGPNGMPVYVERDLTWEPVRAKYVPGIQS